ncbi:MAG: hypothetical protein QXU18_05375 [Thermoplasmatales archaeon]
MGRIIRGIELKNYLPASSGFGNDQRLMEVHTAYGNFRVPDRAITYPEINAKVETGIDIRLEGSVAIYEVSDLDREKIKKLIKREEYYKTSCRNARVAQGRMDSFPLRLISFQVTFNDKRIRNEKGKWKTIPNTSGIGYLEESETNMKEFLSAIADFTRKADFEILVIPQFTEDPSKMKRIYKWILEERQGLGFEDIIPTFSLKMFPDSLIDLVDYIESIDKKSQRVNILAFQHYTGIDRASQAFDISRRLSQSNFISMVFGVDRALHDYEDLSGLHTQPHIIGETVALKKGKWIPPTDEEKKKSGTPPWQTIKFLDPRLPKLDGVFTGMTENRFAEIIDDFRLLFGSEAEREIGVLIEFRRRFPVDSPAQLTDEDKVIIDRTRYLSKLHEYLVSQREFAHLRDTLRGNSQKSYLISRPLLYKILTVDIMD